jgi:hypothetical protein
MTYIELLAIWALGYIPGTLAFIVMVCIEERKLTLVNVFTSLVAGLCSWVMVGFLILWYITEFTHYITSLIKTHPIVIWKRRIV